MAVGRDGNNKMFTSTWVVVEKDTTGSWDWFIQHLQCGLQLGDGLRLALISGMHNVCEIVTYVFI